MSRLINVTTDPNKQKVEAIKSKVVNCNSRVRLHETLKEANGFYNDLTTDPEADFALLVSLESTISEIEQKIDDSFHRG